MDNVISLSSVIHAKKELKSLKLLDITASKTALEVCFNTLNLNSLEELNDIKQEMSKILKKLGEMESGKSL